MVRPCNSMGSEPSAPTTKSASNVISGEPDISISKEHNLSKQHSSVLERYRNLRRKVARIHSSNYDISNICNLRCEGCLYFSDVDRSEKLAVSELKQWRSFFEAEASRGINFAYIAGAEPALTPERISACYDHIPYGVVFSNGSRKIHPDINYRIHVSLWGDENSSKLFRDGNVQKKAFKHYAGDERALFVLTVSNLNIDQIEGIAAQCAEHGIPLTFSFFSPTDDYNLRQSGVFKDDSKYFRISSDQDMRLSPAALKRARETILNAADRHPSTVLISKPYLDWVTGETPLYTLDDTGIAIDCGNRLNKWHRHYNADLSLNSGKCCSPNIDCKDCRAYAMGLGSYLTKFKPLKKELSKNGDWLDTLEHWTEMFLPTAGMDKLQISNSNPESSDTRSEAA